MPPPMASEPKTMQASDAMAVEVVVGREPVEEVLGAVDAALAAGIPGVSVAVRLPASHPGRAALADLCATDPRLTLASEGDGAPAAGTRVRMPASARPGELALARIRDLMDDEGLGEVDVVLPSRSRVAERLRLAGLPGGPRLVATGSGSGRRRMRGPAVGVGSSRVRRELPARPLGTLAHERAEHLRHRARSATYRAQYDRQTQRLARERMQNRHERARLQLAQIRLAGASPGEWVAWRATQAWHLLTA